MQKRSLEDYLRAIYTVLEIKKDKSTGIKSVDIAKERGISKPSVSEMMKKLALEGYIRLNPYSQVFLTKKGLINAKKITHNYRVLEVFLKKVLKYSEKEIPVLAHRLEHAFPQEAMKRLDKYLGNPSRCPHGRIIHG